MKHMKHHKFWLVAITILAMLAVTACGNKTAEEPAQTPAQTPAADNSQASPAPSEAPAAPATIKVGLICGGMTPIVAQIGMNDGSFDKAGLKIEKVCFNGGADAVKALVGGGIDVNLGSYEHVLKMVNNKLGIKAYGEIFNNVGYSLVVKKDSPAQSIADLKGSTLAVTKPGSLSHTALRIGLESNKLDPEKDVQVIGGGSGSSMLAAIESGQVAGGMVSEPTISQMVSSGDYRVLYEPDYDYAGIIIMANSEWVGKNTDAMKTFLKTLKEINEHAQHDPKAAAASMAKEFTTIPLAVLEKAVEYQLSKVPADLKVSEAGAEIVNDGLVQLKVINQPIPYDQAVDLTLLP